MKKTALLHAALSRLVATLGHGDMILIADAGMPAPREGSVECIDLALTPGTPSISATLVALISEMQVESHIVARETLLREDTWIDTLKTLPIGDKRVVSHAELKQLSAQARAYVRTGECTPYANVILVSGVTF